MMNVSLLQSAAQSDATVPREERGGAAVRGVGSNVGADDDDDDPMLRHALQLSLRENGGGGGGGGSGTGGGGGGGGGEETLEEQILARTATLTMDEAPPPAAHPVPQSVRDSFPWLIVDETFNWSGYLGGAEECPICKDAVALGDTLRAMPCCHCYHEHCIQPWMDRNDWCPVCRAPLDPEKQSTTDDDHGGGGEGGDNTGVPSGDAHAKRGAAKSTAASAADKC